MKILVTGSNGFIAKNLIQFLSEKPEIEILKAHRETTDQEFKQSVLAADWIIHLAGVNRPLNEEEFAEGNTTLTEKIAQILQQANKKTPVILSSSIQVERDNPYGKSKLGGEQALVALNQAQGNPVYICRLANVFGKWSRPNYNSAVATFCHNVANDL
ncbi:TPA: NAD-dependent epimerase/dehydratase family protein, partial [Acinetobacter baumannii]|nr:NAD-dependent epimerase/dehydratase family protein [Acinetobacter baumannii]